MLPFIIYLIILDFRLKFIHELFSLVRNTILYLDEPIVIHATWSLLFKFEEIFLGSVYQALLMYHRLVIWIVLLTSLSGLTRRMRVSDNGFLLQRALVTFTWNHASSGSNPTTFLIIYLCDTNYLVTFIFTRVLIPLVIFLYKLVLLLGRLVERVVMVDSMLAALNWQLFTTPHFRRWRLLEYFFIDSVVIF